MASKYAEMSDKDLAKLAEEFGVEITEDMDRQGVEEAVELAELEAEEEAAKAAADPDAKKAKADAADPKTGIIRSLMGGSKKDSKQADPKAAADPGAKANPKAAPASGAPEASKSAKKSPKDKVRVEFLNKGTVQYKGLKWAGKMTRSATREDAEDLMSQFPTRFRILGDE